MNEKEKYKDDQNVFTRHVQLPPNREHIKRVLLKQNEWVQQKLNKYNEKYKGRIPELKKDIKKNIDEILLLIDQYEPLELLSPVAEKLFTYAEEYKESTYGIREISLEYAQSLVLSKKRKTGIQHVTRKVIEEFNNLIEEIILDVMFYFSVDLIEKTKDRDEIQSRLRAIGRYLVVRGDSNPEHHIEMIRDIFTDHDDFLIEHYGFDSDQLIRCVQNLEEQLVNNIRLMDEWVLFCYERDKLIEEFSNEVDFNTFSSGEECKEKFLSLPKAQKLLEKKEKLDYKIKENPFEVVPNEEAPLDLLTLLSSHFGDNSTFVEFEEFPAWPTNDSIIYEAPLIEDNGRFYCFSSVLLFRNIGNILEKWIQSKDENYFQNIYQKKRAEYLENKALEYLGNILPGAQIFGNLFYSIEEKGEKKRYETDGLILYDENIFIIEAKAGKFSRSARRGGPKSIKSDLRKLINDAYEQALRTKEYIQKTIICTI